MPHFFNIFFLLHRPINSIHFEGTVSHIPVSFTGLYFLSKNGNVYTSYRKQMVVPGTDADMRAKAPIDMKTTKGIHR